MPFFVFLSFTLAPLPLLLSMIYQLLSPPPRSMISYLLVHGNRQMAIAKRTCVLLAWAAASLVLALESFFDSAFMRL